MFFESPYALPVGVRMGEDRISTVATEPSKNVVVKRNFNMVHEIENFFGVYLLYNTSERFKGHTYIGFTVDPNRRVKQHNTGKHAGGARRTHGRGPWDMVLIVHGFPNKISALRFEWAWQNPHTSRRLKHVTGKKKSENPFQFRLRVVCEMLRCGPWCCLPLTFRWLKQQYAVDFDPSCMPPKHMPIAYGPVKPVEVQEAPSDHGEGSVCEMQQCCLCLSFISVGSMLSCLDASCSMKAHILCLSQRFLSSSPSARSPVEPLLPIEGKCPQCDATMLWGDLIRAKIGCYQKFQSCDEGDDHWADELQTT